MRAYNQFKRISCGGYPFDFSALESARSSKGKIYIDDLIQEACEQIVEINHATYGLIDVVYIREEKFQGLLRDLFTSLSLPVPSFVKRNIHKKKPVPKKVRYEKLIGQIIGLLRKKSVMVLKDDRYYYKGYPKKLNYLIKKRTELTDIMEH